MTEERLKMCYPILGIYLIIDLLEPKAEFSLDYLAKEEGYFLLDNVWSMYWDLSISFTLLGNFVLLSSFYRHVHLLPELYGMVSFSATLVNEKLS